jgi:hypothetical protein
LTDRGVIGWSVWKIEDSRVGTGTVGTWVFLRPLTFDEEKTHVPLKQL